MSPEWLAHLSIYGHKALQLCGTSSPSTTVYAAKACRSYTNTTLRGAQNAVCMQTGEDAKVQEQTRELPISTHLRFNLVSNANRAGVCSGAHTKAKKALPRASEDSLPVQDLFLSAGLPHMIAAAAAAQRAMAGAPAAADKGIPTHSQPGVYSQQRKEMGWAEQGLPDCCASLLEVAAATGLVAMLNSPQD